MTAHGQLLPQAGVVPTSAQKAGGRVEVQNLGLGIAQHLPDPKMFHDFLMMFHDV